MEEEDARGNAGARSAMKTELTCLPCFFNQVQRTLQHAGVNGDRGRSIVRKAATIVEQASLDEVPARTTTLIHRMLRQETGVDPYAVLKRTYNAIAMKRLPTLRSLAAAAGDGIEGGVRVAISGNVIDFGIYDSIDLDRSVEDAFRLPIDRPVLEEFQERLKTAKRILFLCDNAGEIVFDRVLIEMLGSAGKQVIVAVKGAPVINDATREDANEAGLSECAVVIDNGSDGIGTLLEACSPRFLDEYRKADLIVSKGQANFETLVKEQDERIFFLFKVKCPVVAGFLGRPDGDIVLAGGSRQFASHGR